MSFLLCVGCHDPSPVRTENEGSAQNDVATLPVGTPQPIAVSPVTNLTTRQQKKLDSSLPADVRKILESANEFVLLAAIVRRDGAISYPTTERFDPNTIAEVTAPDIRKDLLETFYLDVSNGENPANCWVPHHKLTARAGDTIVEIEICFSCSRFRGHGPAGQFAGTFAHGDSPQSEVLFNRILVDHGRPVE